MGTRRSILFVCSGNICRSPLAEAVLREKLRERGLAERYVVDSAGTVTDHLGQQSDARMRRTAARNGVVIDHRARRVERTDMKEFDLVIGMDEWHMSALRSLADGEPVEIRKMREFDPEVNAPTGESRAPDVPDPWYGGMEGFERVYEMVDRSCEVLADRLAREAAEDS
ncbi:MAG: low molecular weight protein-tyrosine-phosphatase [Spirochaetota bacterium]